MTEGPDYLRAGDIVRVTGVSIRTARRWIAKRILVSGNVGAHDWWPRVSLSGHDY